MKMRIPRLFPFLPRILYSRVSFLSHVCAFAGEAENPQEAIGSKLWVVCRTDTILATFPCEGDM